MPAAAGLLFRPATPEDAEFAAGCFTAAWPDEPADPILVRHWWETMRLGDHPYREYVVSAAGQPVGFAGWRHAPWEGEGKRYGSLETHLRPGLEVAAILTAMIGRMEVEVLADGAQAFGVGLRENEGWRLPVYRSLGYQPDRLGRWWELLLGPNRERLASQAAETRRRAAAEGVELAPLGSRIDDDEFVRAMWEVSSASERDIPTTVPNVPGPLKQFKLDLRSPATPADRIWVAVGDGGVLGMSWLRYPPQRGNVWTEWTCVSRGARGRGIARALKFETLMQAIELGVDRVRTENDAENAPILHLNDEMGYHSIPGTRLYLKDAT